MSLQDDVTVTFLTPETQLRPVNKGSIAIRVRVRVRGRGRVRVRLRYSIATNR